MRRILRDYQDAGSVNSLLALWGFVDDDTFLTKAGDVGVVYRLAGADYECLDQAQRRDIVHRFEAALRPLDPACRVYQYLCKRRIDPIDAAPCRQRLAHEAIQRRDRLSEHPARGVVRPRPVPRAGVRGPAVSRYQLPASWSLARPRAALRQWLSSTAVIKLLDADLDRAVAQLHHKAAAFEVQLADSVRPTRLGKAEAFRFFRRLLNYTPAKVAGAALQYDTHLDYFVADCAVECQRTHLDVDAARVKVLTMKEPPTATFAHVLEDLYTVPGEFIACLEWQRIPNDRMRRDLQTRRRHFFNKRVSIINYASSETRPEEMPGRRERGRHSQAAWRRVDRTRSARPLLRRVLPHAGSL